MSEQKWHRSSLRHLVDEMEKLGYWLSHTTLSRLLEKLGYSLKANEKRLAGSQHPDRNRQFEYITAQKAAFRAEGLPIISVDTKKKELTPAPPPGACWQLQESGTGMVSCSQGSEQP